MTRMTKTSAVAIAEDEQQLAERLALRLVLAADLERVADRQLHAGQHRLDSATALPRSRPSSRAVTIAICRRFSRSSSAWLPRGTIVHQRRRPATACRSRRESASAQAGWRRSGTRRDSARARGIVRSSSRRSVATSPSHASASCVGHLLDREPEPAGGDGIDVPGDFGAAALQADDVHDALDLASSFGSISSDRSLERVLIVAEDLDFDRRRRAFEVAEHVLQQLHELDLGVGHGLAELVAQAVDDLVGRLAPLAPRLQADEDVAVVLLRREQAQLRSGAADEGRDVGRLVEDVLDLRSRGRCLRAPCRPA